ncbi:MAG TPA: sulfite exporter TauE/SafE family protein [Candidatus Acidoferrales bacterium]|nr:sulfite exporter TauE/SafE family protein [Candidatus Acidoferrales bacterium]HVC23620.1 sulfite exporter TauE/SafE family protein [Candidatus Dormibacteraeota bacterium]
MAGAGLAAGALNAVAGSGSLLTFPTLLALGYSPLVANVSNTVGLFTGNLSGAVGYRRELAGQRGRALRLGACSLVGGLGGAALLLALPPAVFKVVVPALILLAVVLLLLQPHLARRRASAPPTGLRRLALPTSVLATAVYGGYFGAAQGVMFMATLGVFLDDSLQRLTGLKNVLVSAANGAAAVVFIAYGPVAWEPALVLAGSSLLGGQLGAGLGRKLPAPALRAVIVVGGLAAVVKILL